MPRGALLTGQRAWRSAVTCLVVVALGSALLAVPGCSPVVANDASSSAASGAVSSDTAVSPVNLATSEDALLAFAANSSMAVLNGPDADGAAGDPEGYVEKNLCFSPISLYLACTLLGMGTQGMAQEQVLTLLGIEDAEDLQAQAEEVRDQLGQTAGEATMEVADSLWIGEGYEFTEGFLREAEALGAGAFDVTFGTDEANRQIASWVSDQTKGLIKPHTTTQTGQVALLLNTLYFKDAWATPFDQAQNEVADFQAPGVNVQANYLRQEVTDSEYAEGDEFTAARLAFSGGSTMTFVRPRDGVMAYKLFESPQAVLELLDLEMEFATVDWWIPKFETDSSLSYMAETLKALGVVNVFSTEETDAFAPMIATDGGEGFRVSDVQQDTHLALDEGGVLAAASTSIGIERMALAPEAEPVEFKLDKPFLYYLTSPDGVVLFVGVLYNPNL